VKTSRSRGVRREQVPDQGFPGAKSPEVPKFRVLKLLARGPEQPTEGVPVVLEPDDEDEPPLPVAVPARAGEALAAVLGEQDGAVGREVTLVAVLLRNDGTGLLVLLLDDADEVEEAEGGAELLPTLEHGRPGDVLFVALEERERLERLGARPEADVGLDAPALESMLLVQLGGLGGGDRIEYCGDGLGLLRGYCGLGAHDLPPSEDGGVPSTLPTTAESLGRIVTAPNLQDNF